MLMRPAPPKRVEIVIIDGSSLESLPEFPQRLSVRRTFATNTLETINPNLQVRDIGLPHGLIDFRKQCSLPFSDEALFTHVDFTEPCCSERCKGLIQAAKRKSEAIHKRAVYACMECGAVGMVGSPETVFAQEIGICYVSLCYVSTMAAILGKRVSHKKVIEIASLIRPKLGNILIQAVPYLPRNCCCGCGSFKSHENKEK